MKKDCVFCNKKMLEDEYMFPIKEMENGLLFFDKDQRYQGKLIFIYKHSHIVGLEDIPSPYDESFIKELKKVNLALKSSFDDIELLNTLTMGNYIEHCHFHIIPRRKSDKLFGRNPLNGLEDIAHVHLSTKQFEDMKDKILKFL